jgi:hypothetical protein
MNPSAQFVVSIPRTQSSRVFREGHNTNCALSIRLHASGSELLKLIYLVDLEGPMSYADFWLELCNGLFAFHNLARHSGLSMGLERRTLLCLSHRPKELQRQSAGYHDKCQCPLHKLPISRFCNIDIVLPELIFRDATFLDTFKLWLAFFCHTAPR